MSKARRQTEKNLTAESCANACVAEDASATLIPALVTLLEQHRTAIAADFKATSDVINSKLDKIQAEVANQELRIGELETNAEDVVQLLAALEAKYESLQEKNKLFKTKLSDLESRSRRQNICVVGLLESVDPGPRPTFPGRWWRSSVFG